MFGGWRDRYQFLGLSLEMSWILKFKVAPESMSQASMSPWVGRHSTLNRRVMPLPIWLVWADDR